ncbi:MAG TPA: ZIP family metal transporter [Bryobacteraceae bacterium]|jgi:zinc transporter ZupT|nr:ZIP family metal transporter [Bryobacteraceae bacterium]
MHKLLSLVFFIDLLGTMAGIYAMQWREFDRKFIAISGGVLLGVGSFWIWPDIAQQIGAVHSLLTVSVALAALYVFDRYLYPICPCCTHHMRHNCRISPLALLPLVIAICFHNFFDGWVAGLTEQVGSTVRSGITTGLLAHKIPEAALFGMMLRSAAKDNRGALVAAILTASTIVLGGLFHGWLPATSSEALILSLAVTCASFLFLGGHIFWRQRKLLGTRGALVSLAGGVIATVLLEQSTMRFQ